MGRLVPRQLKQFWGVIEPEVAALMAPLGQRVGQDAMAAAEVEDGLLAANPVEERFGPGLGPVAAVGELLGEALVEFAVELQQELLHSGFHGLIIRPMTQAETWEYRKPTAAQLELARAILEEVRAGTPVTKAIRHHPKEEGGFVGKAVLVQAYEELVAIGAWEEDPGVARKIRKKPTRTLSGVTTVTVLTKPYPCPGKCVFCPTDVRMPKSYLPDEPGAMRALNHEFDPFHQTLYRMEALDRIGHPTDKIELLVLGGTWSSYRRDYQEWFVRRCLDAMNGFESETLTEAQAANRTAEHRNVGLVVETRPDHVDEEEIGWLRALGVTKIQMGAQSLDDEILARNRRGHSVAETQQSVRMLRAAAFKVVLHWMPNLLGATLQSDREDFARLWSDPDMRPDELKIYPNQLLEQAELHEIWKKGEFEPYTTEELIDLLADIKPTIPRYCRVNRIIRDFPSDNVVAGNKRTSLRQDAQRELRQRGERCQCVRCREIRGGNADRKELGFEDLTYEAGGSQEHFLSFTTQDDRLAGFLRLSLPTGGAPDLGLSDLVGAALIREVHVYGQSLEIGDEEQEAAQHQGLGTELVQRAETLAAAAGYERMAVISALGTRGYYAKLGYALGDTYMVKPLAA